VNNLKHYFKHPSSKTHLEVSIYKKEEKRNILPDRALTAINKMLDVFKTKLYARRY
jgi:hypothetical protein